MAEAAAANLPSRITVWMRRVVVKRMFSRGGVDARDRPGAVTVINRDRVSGTRGAASGVLGCDRPGVSRRSARSWCGRAAWPSSSCATGCSIRWSCSGDEKVLDVGCGRGLMLIGAAKRLKSGKATGIDIWSQQDLSGNSADAAKQNAKLEGVADACGSRPATRASWFIRTANYDVVMSSLAIHNIPEREEREQAVREMWRVLKPGGSC